MKQIYYVIQTLLRGRGSNIIKVISLGLGLTMSILLFSRVAYEQSFDTCFKDYDNLYQVWSIFSVKGEKFEPQEWNCRSGRKSVPPSVSSPAYSPLILHSLLLNNEV